MAFRRLVLEGVEGVGVLSIRLDEDAVGREVSVRRGIDADADSDPLRSAAKVGDMKPGIAVESLICSQ
jgi:hypothetical protein